MLNLGHMLAKLLTSWHLMALKARFCNVFLFLLMRHCLFIFWMFIPRQAYLRCCKKQQNSRAPGSGLRFLFLCLSGYSGLSLYWLLNFFFPWGLINRKKASQLVNNLWSKLLWPVNSVIFLSTSLLLWRRQWQPTLAWKIPWTEEPGRLQSMGSWWVRHDFTFTFHFHALEKEMATHSSVLAWRIPGTEELGGLLSPGPHRVRHDWNDLAAAAVAACPLEEKLW